MITLCVGINHATVSVSYPYQAYTVTVFPVKIFSLTSTSFHDISRFSRKVVTWIC